VGLIQIRPPTGHWAWFPRSKGLSSVLDAVLEMPFFKLNLPGLQQGLGTLVSGQTADLLAPNSAPPPIVLRRRSRPKDGLARELLIVMLMLKLTVSSEVELAWALDYKPGSRL
jgi:hypothetical protein